MTADDSHDDRGGRESRRTWDRRRFLAAAGTGMLATLAGCGSGEQSDGTTTTTDTPTTPSPTTTTPTPTTEASTSTESTESTTDAGPQPFDISYLHESPTSEFAPAAGFGDVEWLATTDLDVVTVTTLDGEGEGSLRWAVDQSGPTVVVFEVGGVVDLRGDDVEIGSDQVFVAGHTAPSPGITVIRGGIHVSADDVIVQHVRAKPGDRLVDGPLEGPPAPTHDDEPGEGEGSAVDAMHTSGGARNVVLDHCTATWGTDESMSASGGSRAVTFANSLVAQTFDQSPLQPEAHHAKATHVGSNARDISVLGTTYVHNTDRHPRINGNATCVFANNFVFNFAEGVEMYADAGEPATGVIMGNYYRAGPITDTSDPVILHKGADELDRVYNAFNVTDPVGMPVEDLGLTLLSERPLWPEGLVTMHGSDVPEHNVPTAGARPADRTPHDERLVGYAREGGGSIVDRQTEAGGYPDLESSERSLDPPEPGEGLAEWLYQHREAVETGASPP